MNQQEFEIEMMKFAKDSGLTPIEVFESIINLATSLYFTYCINAEVKPELGLFLEIFEEMFMNYEEISNLHKYI